MSHSSKRIWVRIRISLKSGIRIRIKTFWIRHTGLNVTNLIPVASLSAGSYLFGCASGHTQFNYICNSVGVSDMSNKFPLSERNKIMQCSTELRCQPPQSCFVFQKPQILIIKLWPLYYFIKKTSFYLNLLRRLRSCKILKTITLPLFRSMMENIQ